MTLANDKLYSIIKDEIEEATDLRDRLPDPLQYDANQAAKAWEHLGDLFENDPKPSSEDLEKAKDSALNFVSLMNPTRYKQKIRTKILNINL